MGIWCSSCGMPQWEKCLMVCSVGLGLKRNLTASSAIDAGRALVDFRCYRGLSSGQLTISQGRL
eukprot:4626953-Amphidinium_carterae.1